MANAFHLSKPVTDNITYVNADAGVVIEIGDLLYYDGTYAQPASAQADGGSQAANQASAAPLYLGVANSARSGSETADGEVAVVTDRLFYFPCSSAAFEVSDLVTFVESSGGVALEDQVVVKTSDETLSIGRVVKREASATTKVWVRMISRVLPNSASPDTSASLSSATLPILTFNGATGANEIRVPTNLADALSIESTAGDIMVFDTTTGTVVVTFGAAVRVNVAGDAQIGSATTDLVAFHGSTPTDQCAAYTQTYSTADRTHAAPTAATLTAADGAGTNDNTIGAITADASVIAAVQEIVDEINKLIADVADTKQIVNSVIDDLQEKGLVG